MSGSKGGSRCWRMCRRLGRITGARWQDSGTQCRTGSRIRCKCWSRGGRFCGRFRRITGSAEGGAWCWTERRIGCPRGFASWRFRGRSRRTLARFAYIKRQMCSLDKKTKIKWGSLPVDGAVGRGEGRCVGDFVGDSEGSFVGRRVGLRVGRKVGTGVRTGDFVGDSVGVSVGSPICKQKQHFNVRGSCGTYIYSTK